MKRKNVTRNALFTSVLSLLLCVSMLVGTTFAWFTDEVVTGMNTIAAGNLDVELLADGVEVKSDTELFKLDTPNLWEPGVVAYENLQVANAGTLALKYQMTLNIGNENDLNGHKLSEVLKVAIIDKIEDGASRTEVLAKAKAAIEASQSDGSLSNFYLTGELEAGAKSTEQAIVIFWDPNDNATDNLYNANNDKTTSDGQPLHIEFGINLQATQKMSEEDSFGPDYDKFASILPKATVINTGAQTVTARPVQNWNVAGNSMNLDTSFQFLPNETAAQAESSAYKYWHADYVIVADNDVPANSMALAGYYKLFGDYLGTTDWISLTGSEVKAGEEVRLLATMGYYVNYQEICNFANDGIGFLCGAADLTGENVGTTITVELRLYETTKAPDAAGGNANDEVVPEHYEVVGTYTYTFGAYEVKTAEDLQNAINNGVSQIKLGADNVLTEGVTVPADANVVLDLNGKTLSYTNNVAAASSAITNMGTLTIKNGTVTYKGNGDTTNGYATNTITNSGDLTIDGATIINTTEAGASYAIDNAPGSKLVVNSGKIESQKTAIRVQYGTDVTINGGTVLSQNGYAVQIHLLGSGRDTNLTINGGTFTSYRTDYKMALYSTAYGNNTFAGTTVTITGGTFNGDVGFGGGNKTATETVSITGGTFNGDLGRYLANDGWEDIAKP